MIAINNIYISDTRYTRFNIGMIQYAFYHAIGKNKDPIGIAFYKEDRLIHMLHLYEGMHHLESRMVKCLMQYTIKIMKDMYDYNPNF